jgi:hypothetical protein
MFLHHTASFYIAYLNTTVLFNGSNGPLILGPPGSGTIHIQIFDSKWSESNRRNIRFNLLQFASIRFDYLQNIRFHSCPCSMSVSMLHGYMSILHVYTACQCQYCMSMSILHFHVYATCQCLWCMSRSVLLSTSRLQVNVHATSPYPCCMFMFMQQGHRYAA